MPNTKEEAKRQIDYEPPMTVIYGGSGSSSTPSSSVSANSGVHVNATTGAIQLGDTNLSPAIGDWLGVNAALQWVNTHQTRNAQTGTTYAIVTSDRFKLVTFNNAASVAVTMSAPRPTFFPEGWWVELANLGAGTVTLSIATPGEIDGQSTLTLTQYQGVRVFSDGTNYYSVRGRANTNITTVQNGLTLAAAILKLGGTLTENTTIDGNYNFTIAVGQSEGSKEIILKTVQGSCQIQIVTQSGNSPISLTTGGDDGPITLNTDGEDAPIVLDTNNFSHVGLLSPILLATYTGAGVTPTELVGRDAATGKFAPVALSGSGLTHPQVLARTLGS